MFYNMYSLIITKHRLKYKNNFLQIHLLKYNLMKVLTNKVKNK